MHTIPATSSKSLKTEPKDTRLTQGLAPRAQALHPPSSLAAPNRNLVPAAFMLKKISPQQKKFVGFLNTQNFRLSECFTSHSLIDTEQIKGSTNVNDRDTLQRT